MRRNPALLNWSLLPIGVGLLLLLAFSLARLGGSDPDASDLGNPGPAPALHPAAEQTRQFFGWLSHVQRSPLTNSRNPFFTLAIQPPPPPKPPAPPPTTKKVDVTYRGFLETSAGVRRAIVQVADKQIVAKRGDPVVGDFIALDIELRFLSVTNPAGQTLKFGFTTNQPVEISAK